MSALVESLTAHRACGGYEHDTANGKIHGYCVVCLVPWPCEVAQVALDAAKEAKAEPSLASALEQLIPWAEGNHDGAAHCDCDRCEKLDAARAALRAAGRLP